MELATRLSELRGENEARLAAEINAAQQDFQAARVAGTMALVLGLVLTTLANFA